MYRCALVVSAAVAAIFISLPTQAQEAAMSREFPQKALRGIVVFGQPPEIALNDMSARLAPGARIRGQNNLLVMSGALIGVKAHVNFTVDASGLVRDVWILRPEEVANKPWPMTLQEAQAWTFDPAAQRWLKP